MEIKNKSEAIAAIHESMADLHQIGAIDNKMMREFDRACLTPVLKLSPAAIRRIRAKAAVSQAVFFSSPERNRQTCQQVGARRKAAARASGQIAHLSGKKWHRGNRLSHANNRLNHPRAET